MKTEASPSLGLRLAGHFQAGSVAGGIVDLVHFRGSGSEIPIGAREHAQMRDTNYEEGRSRPRLGALLQP